MHLLGMANNEVSSQFLFDIRRKYPNDPTREVYEAAKSTDVDLLNEVLRQMNDSERTSALETKTASNWYGPFDHLQDFFPPLIVVAKKGNVECVSVLLSYKADINCRGDVLSFSLSSPERKQNCTPLMIASCNRHENVVNFLVQHGANMDLQDTDGDTALHYAVRGDALEIAHKLMSLGASQLYNKQRLTPLLLASNNCDGRNQCMTAMVELLINRPECTKEQRIDALELHGASLVTQLFGHAHTEEGFQYMKRGMEERFQDPSHPVLKKPMEPVEGYQNRKESQTLEELVQIEDDDDAITMESLIIRERILGKDNLELLRPIRDVAHIYEESGRFDICIGLHRRAMEIGQYCNQSVNCYVFQIIRLLYTMIHNNFSPRQKVILEVIQQTALECKKLVEEINFIGEKERKCEDVSMKEFREYKDRLHSLGCFLLRLLQILAKVELREKDKNLCIPVLLQKLKPCLRLQNDHGNTLLHLATESLKRFEFYSTYGRSRRRAPFEFPCAKTIKLLLNAGLNVDAFNNNGDTPLHIAVTFKPRDDDDDEDVGDLDDDDDGDDDDDYYYYRDEHVKIQLLTDMLNVLLDGGAHHDFVNNDGKTAMDMAETDEARRILSERKSVQLKCITARAVKKLGLPYLGVVPKTLEKFISMH